jgi:hypothetical protein
VIVCSDSVLNIEADFKEKRRLTAIIKRVTPQVSVVLLVRMRA